MPDTEHIVVIGAMGAGKTTVGERLAGALGRVFHDSDRSIQSRTGRSSREIAETDGVDALHGLEKEVLLESLAREQPAVIAAAASVIEDAEVRRVLSGAFCVWVTTDPGILAERSAGGSHRRPVRQSEHLEDRDRLFRETADVIVDTGDRSVEESVTLVLESLRDADQ